MRGGRRKWTSKSGLAEEGGGEADFGLGEASGVVDGDKVGGGEGFGAGNKTGGAGERADYGFGAGEAGAESGEVAVAVAFG